MAGDVSSVMTREVVTAAPGDTAAEVARRLVARGISAVPVCDEGGRVRGMVSEGDLLRPFGAKAQPAARVVAQPAREGTDLAPEFLRYVREDHHTAKDLMTAPVHTATEDTSLAEAADLLAQHGIKRLPVVRDGRVVGIVSRADLIRAFLGASRPQGAPREAAIGASR